MTSTTAGAKRKRETSSAPDVPPEVVLAKAINNLLKAQNDWTKTIKEFTETTQNTFSDLEFRYKTARRKTEEAEKETEVDAQSRRIQIDLNLKQHARDAAVRVLAEHGERPIRQEDHDTLLKAIEEHKHRYNLDLKQQVEEEKQKTKEKCENSISTMGLKHQAEVAKITAQLDQKQNEVSVLNRTITDLQSNLDKARSLTESVAASISGGMRSQGPVYVKGGQ
jgi:hypothetical protein